MALSISNVVSVQLNTVPKSAARKDFGVVALFTPEAGNAFNDDKTRYVHVNDQREVEQLFGSDSETAKPNREQHRQNLLRKVDCLMELVAYLARRRHGATSNPYHKCSFSGTNY